MLKRFGFVFALILAFAVCAHAQVCRVSKTVYLPGTSTPDKNASITIFKAELSGSVFMNRRMVIARANSSGVLTSTIDGLAGFELPQGARVWLYGDASGLRNLSANPSTGSEYEVPSQSTASLDDLRPMTGVLRVKGDLVISGTGGVPYRFAVCPDNYGPVGDSTATLGWRCAAAGSGGSSATTFYYNTAASYVRTSPIGFISSDATSTAQSVDLSLTSGIPVEVYKSDTSANGVTITYGASTLTLQYAGSWAKFIPNGSSWVLWSLDPTSGGVAAAAGYVYFTTATYTVPSGVGYVDADATAQAQAVTLGTPNASAVEVRKSDATSYTVTITYDASTLVLNSGGQAAKFVPYYNGTTTVWVLLSRTL